MVGRLINDLETHVYVSETHNYKDAYENIRITKQPSLYMFQNTYLLTILNLQEKDLKIATVRIQNPKKKS